MKPSAKLYSLPADLVVRKPFALGRKKYAVGDAFDWETDGVPERRVQQMWDQRWVGTPAELARDKARWEAKKNATKAAQKSMEKVEEPVVPVEEPRRGRRRQAPVTQDEPERPVTVEDLDL